MATTISTQDLENARRDIDDIGKAVNEKVIVSPRYGDDFKSLPMIAEEFQDAINTIVVNDGVPALAVSDASGVTQQEINDAQKNINTILNKTGTTETLAESVDATPFLQSLIDAMPDGMTLDLLGKTFRVKKNTGFQSLYPKGDQPCLVVYGKKNITLTNGTLKVKEHGQGAIEFVDSIACAKYLKIEGAGNFPPLDGNTGRGEKSIEGTGWFDVQMYNAGDPKNNSVDTSTKNTGGFGGNFPQWGGGAASTWGMWNGGFIRNYGHGIYTNNSQITVDKCEIFGFNGSGVVATGGLGGALSTRVSVTNSHIHHCYTAGIEGRCNIEAMNRTLGLLDIHNNYIHDIGHPDSLPTDQDVDPGYGICTSNNNNKATGVMRLIVENNRIFDCKRKGVDAHHTYSTLVNSNKIKNSAHGVMIGITRANDIEDVVITNNIIKDIQYTTTRPAIGIGVSNNVSDSGGLLNLLGNATISNNQIYEVGLEPVYQTGITTAQGRAIDLGGLDSSIMSANTIINKVRVGAVAISAGITDKVFSVSSIISSNIIKGLWQIGTFQRNTAASDVSKKGLTAAHVNTGNIVHLGDYPLAGDQTCVFGDNIKTGGNDLLIDSISASDKLLVSTVPTGSSVTLLYNLGTKGISSLRSNASYAHNVSMSDFNVTYSNSQLVFTIPSYLSNVYSSSVRIVAAIRSATLAVNQLNNTTASRTVSLTALNVALNGSQTVVNIADITNGFIEVTFYL